VHFLDAWTQTSPFDLARLLLPAGLLALAAFVPGRGTGRVAAAAVAIAVLFLGELGPLVPIGLGWAALWGCVAWRVGRGGSRSSRPFPWHSGGIESGAVGLLLGLALLALLIAAVARQDLPADDGRRASYGLLAVCVGLLQLMLRRDAVRSLLAFATLGLGLQVLSHVARDALLPRADAENGAVLMATALAVALADRLARIREQDAGSAWVSDAHDLHD
jgi:hypothetical protein